MTERTFKNKQNTKRNHSLFTNKQISHVTVCSGIKVFYDPNKWERSRGNTSFS